MSIILKVELNAWLLKNCSLHYLLGPTNLGACPCMKEPSKTATQIQSASKSEGVGIVLSMVINLVKIDILSPTHTRTRASSAETPREQCWAYMRERSFKISEVKSIRLTGRNLTCGSFDQYIKYAIE